MEDRVLSAFLQRQYDEATELANSSDILDLYPLDGPPTQHYRAEFHCKGLVREADGKIVEAGHFAVGIWLHDDYLRTAFPARVLTWLGPGNVFHPNLLGEGAGAICAGRIPPGTRLRDLLYQVYEIISYQRVTIREDDALNHDACQWARHNLDRFPLDRRPLRRRRLDLRVEANED